MKKNLQAYPIIFKLMVLIACFMLTILYNKSRAAEITFFPHTYSRVAVNFKQNTEKNELTIRLKADSQATMQLFIFTPDGILVKEVALSVHTTTTIRGLCKGLYLYECFDNDERMKSGSLIIK